jgi:hypothetical protein
MSAAMKPLLDGHREVIGSFEDFEDVDLDEVTPLSLAVLQMCIDAYTVGMPDGERSQPPRAVRVHGRRSGSGRRRGRIIGCPEFGDSATLRAERDSSCHPMSQAVRAAASTP